MNGLRGGFEVDPGVRRKDEPELALALEDALAEDGAKLGEERAQGHIRGLGGAIAPERLGELVASDRPQAVEREEGEEKASLSAGQEALDPAPVELGDESPAELNSSPTALRQRRSNVAPRSKAHNTSCDRRESAMAKVINCECGVVIKGETDDELVANALRHIDRDHPDLVGKRSREDILAAAEEV